MQGPILDRAAVLLAGLPLFCCSFGAAAQQPVRKAADAQSIPIAHTSSKEIQVPGAVEMHSGQMELGNGSAVTAGTDTVDISLTRGGKLRLCRSTAIHLSHDRTIDAPDSTALMLALDRGAIETDYQTGKYSDVVLTPDLRILISGPGQARVNMRVNARGDTCIDNVGSNAPYITVTSQFDGGLYRIRPEQHVTFEHGSLREVVDNEREPCGCPETAPDAIAAGSGKPAGGPSSTPADTEFPLAVSEGLAPPPGEPTTPVAKPGEVHAQVTAPLTYNGEAAAGDGSANRTASGISTGSAVNASRPAAMQDGSGAIHQSQSTPAKAAATTLPVNAPSTQKSSSPGFFHGVGHFFKRIFGGG